MISGIALLLAATLSASPPPAAADADALIARLARPTPAHTSYTEVRFVHLLKRPLVLRGELEYGGTDKLGKSIIAPYRETLRVDAGAVTVQREGQGERHFPLERAPELQALLSGFSALLGGDAMALRRHFGVTLTQDAARWTLTLTPSEAGLAKRLTSLVVDGSGTEPACFTSSETNGDASVMLVGAHAADKLPEPPTLAALSALCRAAQ
jgi:hypothetical protein